MARKALVRGLCILTVALLGACATSVVPDGGPTVEPPIVVDPNPCGWPEEACGGSAVEWLTGIVDLANESPAGTIDDADRESIEARVSQCLQPDLENTDGVHVCDIQDPDVCGKLWEIYLLACQARDLAGDPLPEGGKVDPVDAADKAKAGGLWHTVATDLDIFPSKTPPQADG